MSWIGTETCKSVSDLLVVDLHLLPGNRDALTLKGPGRPCFFDDPPPASARLHRLHLFDTLFEADSVSKAMQASAGEGFLSIEIGVTEEGHGLVLTAQGRGSALAAEASLVFTDHRRDAESGEGGRAIPSPWIGRRAAAEAGRMREMRRLVLMERRGRLLGRLVTEAAADGVSLRSCQRTVVAAVEADVPLDSLSVEEVKDRIEEIMTGIDAEIVLPADRVIRGAITRTIEKEPDRQAKLVDDIAWSLVWGNRVDFL